MVSSRLLWLVVGALMIWGCSGQTKQEAAPKPVIALKKVVPKPVPKPVPLDPFEQRVKTFKDTYAQLACQANRNYDPASNVGTLREPYQRLLQLHEDKSITIDGFRRILEARGYKDVDAYKAEKDFIAKARPGFFDKLSGDLFDFIEACP
jgi:hypothetical protein